MSSWTAIPLLLAFVLQTFSLPFLAFRLEAERETVAIPMCINKERPALNCLGSCYINIHLEAALAQAEQSSGEATPVGGQLSSLVPQWLGHQSSWALAIPARQTPFLNPRTPHWLVGDFRLPQWEPPRV